ncbi:tetratricopeptide repeat protein [Heliobacterium chlorum]|uniref:Tetratricopeptide repeat protein n=1 Tax=Heliobacterium chlorum TaxID=2698 RepID=A0ABR7T601_HELCL|nr:tetratricopeptide repeat protein [Heliobacterium chlorum]MBC9786200.1 tetratricopeptide repeat protein [Heliobacterium chlorum]
MPPRTGGERPARKKNPVVVVTAILIALGLLGSTLALALTSVPKIAQQAPGPSTEEAMENQRQQLESLLADEEAKVKANPNDADAWLGVGNWRMDLGSFYRSKGDAEKSNAYFSQAYVAYQKYLGFKPDNNDARVDAATSAFYSNQLDAAEKEYKTVLQKDPNHWNAYRNYGLFLFQARQNPTAAKDLWQKALAKNPPEDIAGEYHQLIQLVDAMSKQPQPGDNTPSNAPEGLQKPDLSGLGGQNQQK